MRIFIEERRPTGTKVRIVPDLHVGIIRHDAKSMFTCETQVRALLLTY